MSVILFDIDGTLTPGPDFNHMAAVLKALDEVFDLQVTLDEFRQPEFQGSTTPGMAAAALRRRGRERDFAAYGLAWAQAMQEHFREAAIEHPEPFADARRAVESAKAAGHATALLTGNYKAVARLKLSAAGLWDLFDEQLSGFGDDGDDRGDVAIAARDRIITRFGRPVRICVIGDTPRDIACARMIGAYALAVTTGDFEAAELASADRVFATIGAAIHHVCPRRSWDVTQVVADLTVRLMGLREERNKAEVRRHNHRLRRSGLGDGRVRHRFTQSALISHSAAT